MKKVIGLCLVFLFSSVSVSVFALDGKYSAKKEKISTQCCEKMIADLKLDEQQAAEFRKVEAEFRDKMKAERMQADMERQKRHEKMATMKNNRDAELKKILTEEQYKQYLGSQHSHSNRKGHNRRNRG